jgi:hypothetical protein
VKLTKLSEKQHDELRGAISKSLSAGPVFRARLILALAYGLTYREIKQTPGTSAPAVCQIELDVIARGVVTLSRITGTDQKVDDLLQAGDCELDAAFLVQTS